MKAIYPGWWVVLACSIQLAFVSGLGIFAPGVLIVAFKVDPGWTAGEIAGPTFANLIINGLSGPIVGMLVDRYSARTVMLAGTVIMSAAFLGLSQVSTLPGLYVVYSMLAIGFTSLTMVPISTIVASWFTSRRGTALTIAVTGFSLGGAFVLPAFAAVVQQIGWRPAVLAGGIIIFVLNFPVILWLIRPRPPHIAFNEPAGALMSAAASDSRWTVGEAMRTPAFWLLAVSFGTCFLSGNGVLTYEFAHFTEIGLAEQAAYLVSLTTIGGFVIRLFVGWCSDKFHPRNVIIAAFACQSASTLIAAFADAGPGIAFAALALGTNLGGLGILQITVTGRFYGTAGLGPLLGWQNLIANFGAALGPLMIGLLHDSWGSFRIGFAVSAIFGFAACLLMLFVKQPEHSQPLLARRPTVDPI